MKKRSNRFHRYIARLFKGLIGNLIAKAVWELLKDYFDTSLRG